jgi:hypothetical protein
MNFIYRHIVLVGRITALLLFVSSLGFTAVRVICCRPDEAGFHLMADARRVGNEGALNAHRAIAPPGDGCHINVLVGGLNTTPAVFEKDSKLNNTRLDVLSIVVLQDPAHQPRNQALSQSFPVFSENPSPPPLEKYLLNVSLLI